MSVLVAGIVVFLRLTITERCFCFIAASLFGRFHCVPVSALFPVTCLSLCCEFIVVLPPQCASGSCLVISCLVHSVLF